MNQDWPHSPFIRVARKLGLTKAIKETDNDFVLIRKAKILAETTLAQILILEKGMTSLQNIKSIKEKKEIDLLK